MSAGLNEILKFDRVLAQFQTSSHLAFAFLPSNWVHSHALNVFAFNTIGAFCALQCRVHETWARFFVSSMKDDMRYTTSDCFETFPFPLQYEAEPGIDISGANYLESRQSIMQKSRLGLTKTHNRFHDPHEKSPEIAHLRELHAAMDRAVLWAYCWDDLAESARCEFLLDYEEDSDRPYVTALTGTRPNPSF